MPGVDPSISVHRMYVDPYCKPIKQKKRTFSEEKGEPICEEVGKLLGANAIRELLFPTWLANVVLVPKPNGTWWMCTDFTSISKACPKDCYPLPNIDTLVDSSAGYQLVYFLDAFWGYHHIFMVEEDVETTAFIMDYDIYYWKVMAFGLNNPGATYQRMVNKVFSTQIGRNMEIYVDDMLIKNWEAYNHEANLRESFENLRRYTLWLNPNKCVFGVTSGKFMGYMISQSGIEPNPDKIAAVQAMQSPRTQKEVQRLTRRIAALTRFKSRAVGTTIGQACSRGRTTALPNSVRVGIEQRPHKGERAGVKAGVLRQPHDERRQNQHLPRERNEEADRLSQLAMENYGSIHKTTPVEWVREEAFQEKDIMHNTTEGRESMSRPWDQEILEFLSSKIFPKDPPVANKIRRQSLRYTLLDGVLYRRYFQGPLMKYILRVDGLTAVEEMHGGMCISYINGKALTQQNLAIQNILALHSQRCIRAHPEM
ncbi:hypothetical protein LIER_04932 [Lithospermum erythrorhizon]|uniref:Reverse transcriptase domain-containing protein n=1 Tax=Lithospermum erythrorhizon TaxID=34254 RepID=A0AAV3NYJ9_LITER